MGWDKKKNTFDCLIDGIKFFTNIDLLKMAIYFAEIRDQMPKTISGSILRSMEKFELFTKFDFFDTQDVTVAFFMAIITIWIIEHLSKRILNTFGQTWVFQDNRHGGHQGYTRGNFNAQIHRQKDVKPYSRCNSTFYGFWKLTENFSLLLTLRGT